MIKTVKFVWINMFFCSVNICWNFIHVRLSVCFCFDVENLFIYFSLQLFAPKFTGRSRFNLEINKIITIRQIYEHI